MESRKVFCEILESVCYSDRCLYRLSKVIKGNKTCEQCFVHIVDQLEEIKPCGIKKEVPERRKKKKVRAKGSYQAKKNIPSAGLLKIPEGKSEAIKDASQVIKQSYSARDLVSLLGKSERTIQKWAKEGKIPGRKVGIEWQFPKEETDRWLSERKDNTNIKPGTEDQQESPIPFAQPLGNADLEPMEW